jgi:hypothetical protein
MASPRRDLDEGTGWDANGSMGTRWDANGSSAAAIGSRATTLPPPVSVSDLADSGVWGSVRSSLLHDSSGGRGGGGSHGAACEPPLNLSPSEESSIRALLRGK